MKEYLWSTNYGKASWTVNGHERHQQSTDQEVWKATNPRCYCNPLSYAASHIYTQASVTQGHALSEEEDRKLEADGAIKPLKPVSKAVYLFSRDYHPPLPKLGVCLLREMQLHVCGYEDLKLNLTSLTGST